MSKQVDKVNDLSDVAIDSEHSGVDVGEKLHALVHRVRRHLQQASRGQPDGATLMEWRTLGFFARRPGACARDLVEHAGRDKAQVARLVRMLIDRGLLEATPAPHDQRVQQLRLTAAGQRETERMQVHRQRIDRRMLAGLDEGERRLLSDLLDRMHESLGEP